MTDDITGTSRETPDRDRGEARGACCTAAIPSDGSLPADAPPEAVRDVVSAAYTEALRKAQAGAGGCCSRPAAVPAGVAARSAGYGAALADVPVGAAASSFGCGNPLAFADVRPGQTVLDLGSGGGLDMILAARTVGPTGRVIGVDMTDAMVEASRRHLEQAGITWAEVRKGLIETLPVEDASVDWVVSNCVINLSPDKTAVFREIARVLRPGGRLSISDIVAESLPARLRERAAAHAACLGGAISETRYAAGLADAGLADVRVTDRLVYDSRQLAGLVGSDLEAVGVSPEGLTELAEAVTGRVWSARFSARKPGAP